MVDVSCGDFHTMALTDGGAVFTFGHGVVHRLGHGGTNNELVPRRVEGLAVVAIAGIEAGCDHSAAWTGTGELYTWGRGDFGTLGHGGEEDEPRRGNHLPAVKEDATHPAVEEDATRIAPHPRRRRRQ